MSKLSNRSPVVCKSEQSFQIDPSTYTVLKSESSLSPIDEFYEYTSTLVVLGKPDFINASTVHGRLLMLGLVGAAEYYFRSAISGLISRCPACYSCSVDQSILLSAIRYHSEDNLASSIFDGASFSDSKEIIKKTQAITGIPIKNTSSLHEALSEFDKLCQFRHAATHSRGELSVRNMIKLQLQFWDSDKQQLELNLKIDTFHNAVLVCRNVVRSYNQFLFDEVVNKWISIPLFKGTWKEDKEMFKNLFDFFCAKSDNESTENAYAAYRMLLPRIKARLG